jgi:hypothetical protein
MNTDSQASPGQFKRLVGRCRFRPGDSYSLRLQPQAAHHRRDVFSRPTVRPCRSISYPAPTCAAGLDPSGAFERATGEPNARDQGADK